MYCKEIKEIINIQRLREMQTKRKKERQKGRQSMRQTENEIDREIKTRREIDREKDIENERGRKRQRIIEKEKEREKDIEKRRMRETKWEYPSHGYKVMKIKLRFGHAQLFLNPGYFFTYRNRQIDRSISRYIYKQIYL